MTQRLPANATPHAPKGSLASWAKSPEPILFAESCIAATTSAAWTSSRRGKRARLDAQDEARRHKEFEQRTRLVEQERRLRTLDQLEDRERKSLATTALREQRIEDRHSRGVEHLPAPAPRPSLELRPPGRGAAPARAKTRHTGAGAVERNLPKVKTRDRERAAKPESEKLRERFARADRGP